MGVRKRKDISGCDLVTSWAVRQTEVAWFDSTTSDLDNYCVQLITFTKPASSLILCQPAHIPTLLLHCRRITLCAEQQEHISQHNQVITLSRLMTKLPQLPRGSSTSTNLLIKIRTFSQNEDVSLFQYYRKTDKRTCFIFSKDANMLYF